MRISQLFAGPYDRGPRASLFDRVAGAFGRPEELRQQVVLARRPGWERRAAYGRPGIVLPFRSWLDRHSGRALGDELTLFKPDLVAVWDAETASRLPRQEEAVTVGIATDHEGALALRRCRHLLALSPEIAERAIDRGWPEERVQLLPPFAVGDLVDPLPRGLLATPEDSTVILLPYALPVEPLSELLLAVTAVPAVTLWMPEASLRLRKLALRHGVPLRDLTADVDRARAFAAVDLVLCTANCDPFGLGIVEAWAQSKPVIAAGEPATAGLVRHEDSGLVAEAPTAGALAAALFRLLEDPLLYDRLAAAGRAAFDAHHGEGRGLARWLEAYARLGGLILRQPDPPHRRRQPERTNIQV